MPSSISRSVTQAFSASSARFSQRDSPISAGEGTRKSSRLSASAIAPVEAAICQAAIRPASSSAGSSHRPLPQRPHRFLAGGDEGWVGDGGVAVLGARGGSAELGDDPGRAGREHRDPVGEVERLLDVVGDEDDGARVGAQRPGEPLLHLGAGDRVEGCEGLVKGKYRLTGDEGAEESDPLAHAPGEL
jgi:hypothetical protein